MIEHHVMEQAKCIGRFGRMCDAYLKWRRESAGRGCVITRIPMPAVVVRKKSK